MASSSVGEQGQSNIRNTEIRIVLLGKTGVGKSSTGNTILGENRFECKQSLSSVTKECKAEESVVGGRTITVIDTPGFFDTTLPEEDMAKEMAKSVFLSAPGPHAFLFVLPVDRFTKQEEEVLTQIQMMFGDGMLKYLIILFTNGDDIDPETFKSEVNEHNILGPIVESCQGRLNIFNNKDQNNREQVNDLLQKIDSMIEQNGGGHYSNEMLEDAQRFRQEEEERRWRGEERINIEETEDFDMEISDTDPLLQDRKRSKSAFGKFWDLVKQFFRNIAKKASGEKKDK